MDDVWIVYDNCISSIKIVSSMSKFSRLVIYPKDVAAITGKNYRSSWILLTKIKSHLHKEPHQVVTIQEFCEYMGIGEVAVIKLLG